MKIKNCIAVILSGVAAVCLGQEPSLPSGTDGQVTQTREAASAAAPSPSPTVSVEPPVLIPSPLLPVPGIPGLPAAPDLQQLNQLFQQSSMGKAADEILLHTEWRRLENRVADAPDLQALKVSVETSPTDLVKRDHLREYYRLYYKKMNSLPASPELKAYLAGQMAGHLALQDQPRVRPAPIPTPSPSRASR
jgi:hypothetical protein